MQGSLIPHLTGQQSFIFLMDDLQYAFSGTIPESVRGRLGAGAVIRPVIETGPFEVKINDTPWPGLRGE